MARSPTATPTPRKRRRRRSTTERKRSATGKVIGTLIGVAAATGVGTGLTAPVAEAGPSCGGVERWPIKVANDPDAVNGKIDLMPGQPLTVAQVNNQINPGPYAVGGRMEAERKVYTVRGYLSYFKHEGGKKGDQDYHLVITDRPGIFEEDERKPPDGQSMVVELPDTKCFSGKAGGGSSSSALGQAVADARATFEKHVKWPEEKPLTEPVPVTVTGVGFFDFDHRQSGRARPRIGADGKRKVFELHPVTEIVFEGASDDS